jgi:hypothetical protein
MCRVVHMTRLRGFSSDDWIYYHLGYNLTFKYSAVADLHTH